MKELKRENLPNTCGEVKDITIFGNETLFISYTGTKRDKYGVEVKECITSLITGEDLINAISLFKLTQQEMEEDNK